MTTWKQTNGTEGEDSETDGGMDRQNMAEMERERRKTQRERESGRKSISGQEAVST